MPDDQLGSFKIKGMMVYPLPDPYYMVELELDLGDEQHKISVPSFKYGLDKYLFLPQLSFCKKSDSKYWIAYEQDDAGNYIFNYEAKKVVLRYHLHCKVGRLNISGEMADVFEELLTPKSADHVFLMSLSFSDVIYQALGSEMTAAKCSLKVTFDDWMAQVAAGKPY